MTSPMDGFINSFISETLLPPLTPGAEVGGVTLSGRSQSAIQKHIETLDWEFDIQGIETILTGAKLPRWIQPLHFESNLNTALEALKAVDALVTEYRSLILSEMHSRFVGLELIRHYGDEPQADIGQFMQLTKSLNYKSIKAGLEFRISKRMIDLIEYSKAAKIGAKVLFEIDEDDIEVEGLNDSDYPDVLSKLREPLRRLAEEYRILATSMSEELIPVSLKHGKDHSGNFVANWTGDSETSQQNHTTGLGQSELTIDLRSFDKLVPRHRVLKMGIQIIDKDADKLIKRTQPDTTEYQDDMPGMWSLEIAPIDQTQHFGEARNYHHTIFNKMSLSNVLGGRHTESLVWINDPSLLNSNGNKKWKIKIKSNTHEEKTYNEIRDIFLYFHVSKKAGL